MRGSTRDSGHDIERSKRRKKDEEKEKKEADVKIPEQERQKHVGLFKETEKSYLLNVKKVAAFG